MSTTIDTDAPRSSLLDAVPLILEGGGIPELHGLVNELVRTVVSLTVERDEQNRLYKGALLNVQTSVAHAAKLNAENEALRDLIQCAECNEELHGDMYYGWMPGLCPRCQAEERA